MAMANWIAHHLWIIPLLPLLASLVVGFLPAHRGRIGAFIAIAAMAAATLLAVVAFGVTVVHKQPVIENFTWFHAGDSPVRLGWILDPLSAMMLLLVSVVGTLIFVFSIGYMRDDPRVGAFFGLLSFFAAAMLGLVVANSLLLLFIFWELVGLASYLLIGF